MHTSFQLLNLVHIRVQHRFQQLFIRELRAGLMCKELHSSQLQSQQRILKLVLVTVAAVGDWECVLAFEGLVNEEDAEICKQIVL